MKIEIDIPIEEFDRYDDWDDVEGNDMCSFADIIIDRVANKMLANICGSYQADINKILSDKVNQVKQTIESRITKELSENVYVEMRDKVTERVIKDTTERYERSRQYQNIKKQLELESDSAILTGMKTLISDIVKAEVKKIIKL